MPDFRVILHKITINSFIYLLVLKVKLVSDTSIVKKK